MPRPEPVDPGPRLLTRAVLAWALWDWGSAAFNAVVTTFVFTVYLTSRAFGEADHTSSALGAALTVAGITVALLAPITGQRADRAGRRTWWLGFFTAVVVILSAALFFVRPDPAYLWLGVALVALATVFFEFAQVNYNAMLPGIATAATLGRVSGIGWGAGYFGGIVLLLLLVVGFIAPDVGWFGVSDADGLDVRTAMLVAAGWFAISALPVLVTVRDPHPGAASARSAGATSVGVLGPRTLGRRRVPGLLGAYRRLWHTIGDLFGRDRHAVYFLVASAVFRDGLVGVFTFGGIIAAGTFGFSASTVIAFGIAANVVSGVATVASGALDDRWGPKRVIVCSLSSMIVAGVALFVFRDGGPVAFWVLGLFLCVFVGPAQSASRSYLVRLLRPGQEGVMFGLYATTGRAVSFLAPLMFSASIALGGAVVAGPAQHFGILGLVFVLGLGLILLAPVRPAAPLSGHPAAHTARADGPTATP